MSESENQKAQKTLKKWMPVGGSYTRMQHSAGVVFGGLFGFGFGAAGGALLDFAFTGGVSTTLCLVFGGCNAAKTVTPSVIGLIKNEDDWTNGNKQKIKASAQVYTALFSMEEKYNETFNKLAKASNPDIKAGLEKEISEIFNDAKTLKDQYRVVSEGNVPKEQQNGEYVFKLKTEEQANDTTQQPKLKKLGR